MHFINESRFNELLQKFSTLHVLVVGDFFLDKYLSMDPALTEISLETGLEAYQVVEIRHSPGAAGTVVSNLRALDVQVSVVGVIGQDGAGFELKQGLRQRQVNLAGLLEAADRFTPTYTKPMMRAGESGNPEHELNRLDIKNRQPLPTALENAVIVQLEQLAPTVAAVIIADQVQERNCGVITAKVRAALARLAEAYPAKIFVADSRVRIGEFEGVMVKPNLTEARSAVKAEQRPDALNTDAPLALAGACGQALFARNHQPVFVTVGAQGIVIVTAAGIDHVPGIPATGPIDVVGAGDSVMAGLVACLGAGGSTKEAAILGNMAASITIQQLGTTGVASQEQLRQRFAEMNRLSNST